MSTTFETLKTLGREYNGKSNFKSILENYVQPSTQDITIAYLFCKNYLTIRKITSGYLALLTEEDIDSAILTAIPKAINSFDLNKTANIHTYINNCAKYEIRSLAAKVSINERNVFLKAERFEKTFETKDSVDEMISADREIAVACSVTDDHSVLELNSLIRSLNLSDTQKQYLEIIIANPGLKDIDVAKILGVGRSSISMLKKRIQEKVRTFGLN